METLMSPHSGEGRGPGQGGGGGGGGGRLEDLASARIFSQH